MPYQPYQPNWTGQYMAAMQQPMQYQQPAQYQQQPQQPTQFQQPMAQVAQQMSGVMKVDGPDEAMNRIIMRYPSALLVPGFVSDPVFDVNGRQFHALSVESDGRRHLETFDYTPHVEEDPVEINGVKFASKKEFDELAAKFAVVMEAINELRTAVPAAGSVPTAEGVAGAAHEGGNVAQSGPTGRHAGPPRQGADV